MGSQFVDSYNFYNTKYLTIQCMVLILYVSLALPTLQTIVLGRMSFCNIVLVIIESIF